MKLSKDRFHRAVDFIQTSARPLEQALYRYHFADGTADDVLRELEKFQNEDGGFGHGLEPDLRLKDSSVIATTIAFQRFREVNAPGDHPVVVKACGYLASNYDAARVNWRIIPANVDDAPHAPWWTPGGDLEKSMSNPRAEIAGYLNEYPQHFPAEMRETVTQSVVDFLFSQPDAMEMHDLLCYLRFYQTPALASDTRLLDKLKRVVNATVERDPEQWRNYGLQPLAVITSPESPFAADFTDAIQHNLDFIIQNQGEDGGWGPNWSWGNQWEEAWEQAKREVSGVITLDNLLKLRSFGRIE